MAIFKYITENGTGIDLKQVEADLSGNESNKEEIENATVKTDAEVDIKKVEEDLSGNESNKEEIENATTKTDDGIDLKQVEDDLSDNASNEEEIEAAGEGLVGDPVEEAFYIMYESTYNMNELMKAVGIAELKEAYNGKELVLEAVDLDAFWENCKKILEKISLKISEIVNNIAMHILNTAKQDEKLYNGNTESIARGLKADKFTFNGFIFAKDDEFIIDNGKITSSANEIVKEFGDKFADARVAMNNSSEEYNADKLEEKKNGIVENMYKNYSINSDKKEIKDLAANISKKLRGGAEEPVELKGKITADDIKAILCNGKNTAQELKAWWNGIRADYIKHIDNIDKKAKNEKKNNNNDLFVIASFYSKLLVFDRNVTSAVVSAVIKEATAKRNQARRVARAAIHYFTVKKASATDEDVNALKAEVVESAQISNAFANIKIV